jgi:MFS family permease
VITATAERIEEARRASFFVFIILGHLALCSVAWVPEYIDRLGVSFAVWGTILGVAPIGAMAAVLIATRVLLRFGIRRVMWAGVGLASVNLVLLGFVTDYLLWAVVNLAFNFFSSLAGVAINSHSVTVQKRIHRPVMGSLHGGWSLGAVLAALTGGTATVLISLELYLVGVAVLTVGGFALVAGKLLGPEEDGYRHEHATTPTARFYQYPLRLWLIAFGFFAAVLPEVTVWDWSAVFARDSLGSELAWRSIPFAAFMTGMIVGRFTLAKRAERTEVHILAFRGGLVSAVFLTAGVFAGPALVGLSPWLALGFVVVVWFIAGFGIAPLGPTFMAASGHVDGVASARAVSLLSFIAQVVSVGAKILMGAMAQGINVGAAFWLPIVILVIGAWLALTQTKNGPIADIDSYQPPTGPMPIIRQPE